MQEKLNPKMPIPKEKFDPKMPIPKEKLDPEMPIPNCVRRVVIHTFQPKMEEVWRDANGLGISSL